jgi:hypothetical protein
MYHTLLEILTSEIVQNFSLKNNFLFSSDKNERMRIWVVRVGESEGVSSALALTLTLTLTLTHPPLPTHCTLTLTLIPTLTYILTRPL